MADSMGRLNGMAEGIQCLSDKIFHGGLQLRLYTVPHTHAMTIAALWSCVVLRRAVSWPTPFPPQPFFRTGAATMQSTASSLLFAQTC